jgi:hypothetical protein
MKMSKSSILHINLCGLANPIQRIQVCSKFKEYCESYIYFRVKVLCRGMARLNLTRDNEGWFSYDEVNLT